LLYFSSDMESIQRIYHLYHDGPDFCGRIELSLLALQALCWASDGLHFQKGISTESVR
jgi:hypothetical protein